MEELREIKAKSHAGVYLGTTGGDKGSRETLANALRELHVLIAGSLGVGDQYGDINLSVNIRAGRVTIAETSRNVTWRNLEKNGKDV